MNNTTIPMTNCEGLSVYDTGEYETVSGYCRSCDQLNPWCGQFGAQRMVEIIYLLTVVVVGTLGNILVICSILHANRLYKHGNVFVVNLAIVDLVVTGLYMPTMVANVIRTQQAIPGAMCDVAAFLIFLTCTCSINNLALIAVNRYFSIIHAQKYQKVFSRNMMIIFAFGTWVWSFLLGIPLITGWSALRFDPKMMLCSWDDEFSISYNIFATTFAIIIPGIVTATCYILLFRAVKSKNMMRKVRASVNSQKSSTKKEMNLLKTLLITVVIFFLSWSPYGGTILIDPKGIDYNAKKVFGWMGITNSAMNFIIYGLMNRVYRKNYAQFIAYIFCRTSKRTGAKFASSSDFTSGTRKTRKLSRQSTAATLVVQANGKVDSETKM